MKAIILSAGQGKRLAPHTATRPKCLLPLSGRTLLEWQLRALQLNGVTETVVVTGFATETVEAEIAGLDLPGMRVRTLFNPFFAVADNIGSCWMAVPEMTGDFLLINGDTLFEPGIPARVMAQASMPVTITIDRKGDYDSDDMKVRVENGRLLDVGKTLPLEIVTGESIGMLMFRGNGGALFAEMLRSTLRESDGTKRWYLSVIDRLAKTGVVGAASIEGRQWGEVDFPQDIDSATALTAGWAQSRLFDALADAAQGDAARSAAI